MNISTEQRFRRVQEAAQSGLVRRCREREEAVIARMLTAFRSETATSEFLFGCVAAISELRSLANDAERDLMQASDDAASFSQPSR